MSALAYPGAVIGGRYRVEYVLGRGGMGVVVGAVHLELGQRVALKLLRDEHASDAEIVERLMREARAAATLKSDHVARVLDVGRLPSGAPFIVMEWLEGRDAGALLALGRLPIADAVGIVAQACEALAEAHAHGIVHRDVKPQNIFVTQKSDGTAHVKVLDFGIARHTRATSKLTQTATVIGSPPYMAPEQMIAGEVDARTDVWSLGATLYELLTGHVPFAGATMPEIYARIVQGPPQSPLFLRAEIPAPLADIVLKCLSRVPDDRPSDAAALARELAPFAPKSIAMSVARLAPIAWGTTTKQPMVSGKRSLAMPIAAGAGVAIAIGIAAIAWPSAPKPIPSARATPSAGPPSVSSTPATIAPSAVPVEKLLPPLTATVSARPPPVRSIPTPKPSASAGSPPPRSTDPMSVRKW